MGGTLQAALMAKIEGRTATVGVIGLGYVGLPLAATVGGAGFRVIGFDIDQAKIDRLRRAESYIDAVGDDAVAGLNASGRAEWSADFARLRTCDVVVICVPTPLTKTREPDLSFVVGTAETVRRHVRAGALVVLESTTYPGTTEEVVAPILEAGGRSSGRDFFLAYSPEREDPGNAAFKTATIPKIVAGHGDAAAALAEAFYGGIVETVVPVSDTRAAEAVKITENVFRAVNIALVNELKMIYDAMGIDVWEVIDGAATKPFGYMPFYPGPGLGGHCIPIDPFYLSWKARESQLPARFIELAGEINVNMPNYVVQKTREALDKAHGIGLSVADILVLGVSYKKNISDIRESPALEIITLLQEFGANVRYLDPYVPEIPVTREFGHLRGKRSEDQESIEYSRYHAVLILADHDGVDYERLAAAMVPVVDTRNVFARRGLPIDRLTKA